MWLPAGVARLFLAAWPPDAVVDRLAAWLPARPAPGVRWVPPENWHVTLRFLGRAEPDEALAALASLQAASAEAVVGPRVTTLGRSIVCLPVGGLDRLAAAVRAATASVGEPPEPRPFTGHLTLARRKGRAKAPAVGAEYSDRFLVTEVALVSSTTAADGARYHVLARQPLAAPQR